MFYHKAPNWKSKTVAFERESAVTPNNTPPLSVPLARPCRARCSYQLWSCFQRPNKAFFFSSASRTSGPQVAGWQRWRHTKSAHGCEFLQREGGIADFRSAAAAQLKTTNNWEDFLFNLRNINKDLKSQWNVVHRVFISSNVTDFCPISLTGGGGLKDKSTQKNENSVIVYLPFW